MEACKYCNTSGSDDEYVTATSETISSSDASSSNVSAASIPSHQSSNYRSAMEAAIEASRVHWSELSTELSAGEEQKQREQIVNSNREVFRNLVEKTEVSGFKEFNLNFLGNDDILLEEKIAEGGQAEIYLAECREKNSGEMRKVVMKVFKLEGAPLLHLQHQLSQGFLKNPDHVYCSCIYGANLLDDGRFCISDEEVLGGFAKADRSEDARQPSPRPSFRHFQVHSHHATNCTGDDRIATKKCYSPGLASIQCACASLS